MSHDYSEDRLIQKSTAEFIANGLQTIPPNGNAKGINER